jgi:hypothetical protein
VLNFRFKGYRNLLIKVSFSAGYIALVTSAGDEVKWDKRDRLNRFRIHSEYIQNNLPEKRFLVNVAYRELKRNCHRFFVS